MSNTPFPNIPGAGAMTDSLECVKNLWGSMGVPGMSMPSLAAPAMSVEDLDKKIADLKAVEAWLNINGTMLRGTIQALEIQRGTIATLKSMGAALSNAVKQPGANEKSVLAAAPYASAFFSQPAPEAPPAKVETPPAAAGAPGHAAASTMANPALWWTMLQDQFQQAVSTAMSPDAMAGAAAMAQENVTKGLNKAMGQPDTKAEEKEEPSKKRAAAKPRNGKPE